MYRVLITGAIHPRGVELLSQESDLEVDFRPDLPIEEVRKMIGPYHCIISRSETPVDRDLIDRANNLKVIARAGVGVANIDVDYATEKGVLVVNTPGKNTNSAAEMAMGLLVSLLRKIPQANETMRNMGWDRHRFSGMELKDKTIGIIGLGNVGHRMARFCQGFDMRVLAYDPYIADEVFERNRVQKVDFETLITESDVISVHTPKNKETVSLINADNIARMKPGVILVNAARGGIVDEQALLDALNSGQVAGAAIDTWSEEPMKNNPFADLPNVVMSPHIGASTPEAQMRIAESLADQVPKALRGGIVDYPVNMPQIRMLQGDLMTSYTVLVEKLGSFAAQFINFQPERLEITYRGDIAKYDCTLLRLAFLKGYLKHGNEFVSYVNADQQAKIANLRVDTSEDPGFNQYESAVTFTFTAGEQRFNIGGVVFPGQHARIALVDDFPYEIEPSGNFLAIRTHDRLGVVSSISSILDQHGLLINRFEFSHNQQRKRSMFLIRVSKPIPDNVLDDFNKQEHITLVKRIVI